MLRPWIFLLCTAVVLGAVTAQEDSWNLDNEDYWWSDEAPEEDLGLVEYKERQDTDVSADNDPIDLDNEKEEPVDKATPLENPEDIIDTFRENASEDDAPLDNAKESDIAVQEEIDQFRKELEEPEGEVDNFDDYQFEDNRSEAKEADENVAADLPSDNEGSFEREDVNENDEAVPLPEEDNYPEFEGALSDDDLPPLPAPDMDQIVEDAKNRLEEDNSPFEEDMEIREESQDETNLDLASAKTYNLELNDHLLSENDDIDREEKDVDFASVESNNNEVNDDLTQNDDNIDAMDEDDSFDDIIENKQNEEIEEFEAQLPGSFEKDSEEESAAMDEEPLIKYEDDMISNDENAKSVEEDVKEIDSDASSDDNVATNENNSDEPFEDNMEASDETEDKLEDGDDTVDKVYADLHADLEKLFETWDKLSDGSDDEEQADDEVLEYEEKYGKPFREDVVLSQRDYDNFDEDGDNIDSNLDDIFGQANEASDETVEDTQKDDLLTNLLTMQVDSESDEKQLPIQYENDALEPENKNENPEAETALKEDRSTTIRSISVDDLTPSQYNDLMKQFVAVHSEELDMQSEDFGKNIAPVHMTISVDEALEITSPNYPNTYPSNNVIDWILEGEGMGIELNITDLEVRGVNGDYLLVKPGSIDDSSYEGLVFSYHLTEPRHYRFTDVDRMFLRFETGPGLGFLKGFRLSVKMIWPPEAVPEPEPTPEALVPPPTATLTVALAGLTIQDFQESKEEFRRVLADMATVYINANNIDMGLNTTSEVTQITNVDICNINWPNYEECVKVTFGVPLVYDDEEPTRLTEGDLKTMWETYVFQDPFALRLRNMGISEFQVPNEGRVLMVWLVIGAGVIISTVLLALALWRYSCFEDYTRMKAYSDTDSLREEKPGLEDLYPTPHQTLPPLYADNDFKWADAKFDDTTRVDMGGFTNRSYVRDELLDIDSEDEVVTPRDRNTGITPRDMYTV